MGLVGKIKKLNRKYTSLKMTIIKIYKKKKKRVGTRFIKGKQKKTAKDGIFKILDQVPAKLCKIK